MLSNVSFGAERIDKAHGWLLTGAELKHPGECFENNCRVREFSHCRRVHTSTPRDV
jgi:hypothetical protein